MAFYWQIVCPNNATVLTVRSQLILSGNHVWHRVQPRWENNQTEMYSSQSHQFITPVLCLHYLVPSSKDRGFASQAKADGTNYARLAGSIGSNNHVQIWSRIHFSVVISPVKRNVNIWFPAVSLKRASIESLRGHCLDFYVFMIIKMTQKQHRIYLFQIISNGSKIETVHQDVCALTSYIYFINDCEVSLIQISE